MIVATAEREKMERERYSMLYGIENHLDAAHYDFVIETMPSLHKKHSTK